MSMSDARLAASLAEQAGALVLELRDRSGFTGRDLGRRSDTDSNVLLLQRLAAERLGDAVLSEESVDSPARLSADRVWIIDPLDSTREYGMPPRTDWAVQWRCGSAARASPPRRSLCRPTPKHRAV